MSDSLSRLVEAVRSAGVDIAPGYCEYVRLAFAIANDCGEAGREGFIALCSLSVKFNREKAERLFSNSLKKGDHRIHLGTAFHLAELAGLYERRRESMPIYVRDGTDAGENRCK